MALDTIVSHEKLDGIAGAIRTKGGTSAPLTLDQMPTAILAIPAGGGGGTSPFLEQALKNPNDSSNDPHDIDLDLAAWGDSSPYSGNAKIRDYAFYNTSGNMSVPARRLGNVVIPAWINQVGAYAFQSAGITSVEFAANDTTMLTISAYAFANQNSLTSVKGTRAVSFNGNCAFRDCKNLATIDIKMYAWSGVYNYTFAGCTGLTRAILRCDNHMSGIEAAAFSGCTNLGELVINENNTSPYLLVSLASDSLNNVPETCRIYVPDAQVDAYKAATNWSVRADNIYPLSLFVEA